MKGFREKCGKPPFWAFWPKLANFGQLLAKMGETGFFFQKSAWNIFPPLQALTAKVHKKVMNGFWGTALRTGKQTWFLRSQTTSSRDQKCRKRSEFLSVNFFRQREEETTWWPLIFSNQIQGQFKDFSRILCPFWPFFKDFFTKIQGLQGNLKKFPEN